MSIPTRIAEALEDLEVEHERLLDQIVQLRAPHASNYTMPLPTFEQLMALYKQRDKMANVLNNLRSYYTDES